MKFIEQIRQRRTRRASVRASRRASIEYRKLADQSRSGGGWVPDPKIPNRIFVTGTSATLDWKWAYSLEILERSYVALKKQLAASYDGFTPSSVRLQVEISYAGKILSDKALLARFTPLEGFRELKGISATVILDGDDVALEIRRSCYYEGYGFYVIGHPDRPESGLMCRPIPDTLALLAGESTI